MLASVPESECIWPRLRRDVARPPGGVGAASRRRRSRRRAAACPAPRRPPAASSALSCRVPARASARHQSFMPVLRLLQEAAVSLALQQRQQLAQRRPAVARPARPRPGSAGRCAADRGRSGRRAPGPAWDRTRCRGSEVPTISSVSQLLDGLLRRPGAEQADAAGGVGAVVRHRRLAEQRLDDRRAQQFGELLQLVAWRGGRRGRRGWRSSCRRSSTSAARRRSSADGQGGAAGVARRSCGAGTLRVRPLAARLRPGGRRES